MWATRAALCTGAVHVRSFPHLLRLTVGCRALPSWAGLVHYGLTQGEGRHLDAGSRKGGREINFGEVLGKAIRRVKASEGKWGGE